MAKKWTNDRIDSNLLESERTFRRITDVTVVPQPSTTPIKWECLIDNHVWEANVDNIVNKNSGCPKCSNSIPLTTGEITARIAVRSKAVCLETYSGSQAESRRGLFECTKCSNQWKALIHNVLSHGYGCPLCNANMSTPCSSSDGEYFHSKLERSFWEALMPIKHHFEVIRQAQYVHTRRFSCDFYFPMLMLLVEISGKSMLARPDYRKTIDLKYRMAEAGHRHLVVLSDLTEINQFISNLKESFT